MPGACDRRATPRGGMPRRPRRHRNCETQYLATVLSGLALVSLMVLLEGWASASTLTVTDFGDTGAPGQLRSLVNAAVSGDTILIPPGTIVLTGVSGEDANASGDLDLLKNVTIAGAGSQLTIIDANHVDRIFDIRSGIFVKISGLTLRNGSVNLALGGGLLNRGVSTTLVDVIVEDNVGGEGGGIANFPGGKVVLNRSTVRNNVSMGSYHGGGISNGGGMLITQSTISGNAVLGTAAGSLGGGIFNSGSMTMRDSTVVGNVGRATSAAAFTRSPAGR